MHTYPMNCNATIKKEEQFFNTLNEVQSKRKGDILLIDDFNSHIGNEEEDIVRRFGQDENKNINGSR